MFRFIIPTILVGVSVAGFLMFTNPLYNEINTQKERSASLNQALDNAKTLREERDKLTKKFNSISEEDRAKLEKLLPDNVDNIRLILEIEKIAGPYGMLLKEVKYNPTPKKSTTGAPSGGEVVQGGIDPTSNKSYGVLDLAFSTQGTYDNFIYFIKDLEKNLRIVDISSIDFSSDLGPQDSKLPADSIYKYNFKIKTYWLKN
ncbi:hypothetical protein HZA26_01525 [Candidatus Nomurabacteria bacterium]|nr:hypothetical protein [Candidatus Nomurabacteria bacterium]